MPSHPTPPGIALIAAMARHRVIGAANRMPWHLGADLKRFRAITTGHPVVMGRRTFDAIGRPLPGRRNILISRSSAPAIDGCDRVTSLADALALAGTASTVFVIGGGEIYAQALPLATSMYLTHLDLEVEGDTWFPEFDAAQWRILRQERHHHDGTPAFDYRFVDYERIR